MTWRHDVDASLESAVLMAEAERDIGVRATFYLMARSPYYNPCSWESRAMIARIVACGHRLGVHVDLDAPRDAVVTLQQASTAATVDYQLLRVVNGGRVSFHCPPDSILWRDLPGWDSAYAARWHNRYLSDSGGTFAYGDPEDHPGRPLQVNLHPEHWFGGMPDDRPEFWR